MLFRSTGPTHNGRRACWPTAAVLAFLLVFLSAAVNGAAAANLLVIDTDGGTDGLGAIATVVHHGSARSLALVTVTGTAWGTLASAERNVRGFLRLAQREDVTVAGGSSATLGDTPDPNSVSRDPLSAGGSCDDERLFPPTPLMAAARAMPISRYDVDNLYGFADSLPLPDASSPTTVAVDSTDALATLLTRASTTATRIDYIALAGLTNLGRFLRATAVANPAAYAAAQRLLNVHIFESGNSLPLDAAATATVLGAGLYGKLYMPTFFASVTFSYATWGQLQLSAQSPSAPADLQFLINAWTGRSDLVNGLRPDAFFADRTVDSAFIVMCVIDEKVRAAGLAAGVLGGDGQLLHLNGTNVRTAALEPTPRVLIAGNNVTRGMYLGRRPTPADSLAGFVVVDKAASYRASPHDASVLDAFWSAWLPLFVAV